MTKNQKTTSDAVLKSLGDPVRRRLFDFVSQSSAPVGRDEAAKASGTSRTLAAYHLDKLTEAGLLATTFARIQGKTGPGAGRPAKLYELAQEEVSLSVPPRNYRLLSSLLAAAAAADESGMVQQALLEAARSEGESLGAGADDLMQLLDELGYAPVQEDDGSICMENCPFHMVAQHQTQLVCSMNYHLIDGVLRGCACTSAQAELSPRPGKCCVVIHPDSQSSVGKLPPVGG
ncbi:ArsR family transcriptional regulator [Glutamicibacter uratoxydans]|uniref:ArsR family transcriptional regulator n=1 Tax=Glutamicibacter uratoxydans TaxID=43667 RepID=A0A4Y4DM09_GLUUR|nr:helix-turn-helix domain-containing protein [Glutamicibacter uratoxydans]GED05643.1 ArsR family transcriptional regulator [Glutamicibacter uratoxydans]